MAATITTAASTSLGRFCRSDGANTRSNAIAIAPTIPVSCERAPALERPIESGWMGLWMRNSLAAVGAGALFANIADNNTATGAGAFLSNTTGIGNTATGSFALLNDAEDVENAAFSASALLHSTIGDGDTLRSLTTLPVPPIQLGL